MGSITTHVKPNTAPPSGAGRAGALVALVRLRWFIHLRWVIIACSAILLGIEAIVLGDEQRPFGLVVTLGLLAAVNLLWMTASRSLHRSIAERGEDDPATERSAAVFANGQIAIDLLILTAILRFTGGIESPMALFYLFHMAIAPMLLPNWEAYLQGIWATALYAVLATAEASQWITPHYCFLIGTGPGVHYLQPMFVFASVAVVGAGISGTLYFTGRISARLYERERVLRAVNQALRDSQEAIEALQQRKSSFMRTAAHQLKSPLAVIQTQVGLLRDGIVPEDTIEPTYRKIIKRCRDAIDQVTDLLTFARVQDAEGSEANHAVTDLRQVLLEVCLDHYAPIAHEKGLKLDVRFPTEEDVMIHIARTDLSDALANLVENAIKYTPAPGDIHVRLDQRDEQAIVSIQDTGMGFDEEKQEQLFDAYRRDNRALEAGISGSGLGLSIVRAVVERASGHIDVRSEIGKGSTFTLTFPLADETP